jgi:hypothetical protein
MASVRSTNAVSIAAARPASEVSIFTRARPWLLTSRVQTDSSRINSNRELVIEAARGDSEVLVRGGRNLDAAIGGDVRQPIGQSAATRSQVATLSP